MEPSISKIALPNGKQLIFEDDVDLPGGERLVSVKDVTKDINFESAMDSIKSAAELLLQTFGDLSRRPDGCELEFGIKLSAAAGAILAKASAEANFSVKLTWSPAKEPAAAASSTASPGK